MNPETPKLETRTYEPFDPEAELKNLRKGDKETRPEKLEEYKKELIRQKEGIAEIQNDLEQQIRENPDLAHEELMKTVLEKSPEYRLSENQLNLFKETLNRYVTKHQAVREARKQYPYDRKLFKACFGKKPEGVVEVIEGPVTLYFRCHNLKDFAWIRQEKFFELRRKQKLTRSDIQIADTFAGALVRRCLIPPLKNAITIENAAGAPVESRDATATLQHEEQHAIKRLFKEQQISTQAARDFEVTNSLKHLAAYLRFLRKKDFENRAKDEISAFYKIKEPIADIKNLLLKEGGSYDFYFKSKKDYEQLIKWYMRNEAFKKNKGDIEKIMNQVFVDEYEEEIKKSIAAIKDLENMGKSRDEIIHLLITEPLSRWDKLVKRIKKHGKSSGFAEKQKSALG